MIFIAKNEKGDVSWKLVLDDRKTVTRRLTPMPVGKEFAVQPGRGKFAVCRCSVISCMTYGEWVDTFWHDSKFIDIVRIFDEEAKKEGFQKWINLYNWLAKKGLQLKELYRIEFKKVK